MKRFCIWLGTIVSIILIGVILISLAYAISPKSLEENLEESRAVFQKEKMYQKVIPIMYTSTLDNYTDALMLLIASYRGSEPLIDKGMNNYRIYVEGTSPYEQMANDFSSAPTEVKSYYRYWHGYVIFLRPLLAIFNYQQIRIINTIVHVILLITLCLLMKKNNLGKYIFPFISVYLIMCPPSLFLSLQNSTIWHITCISVIIYLVFKEKIVEKNLHYLLFTVVGMLTSYMDFLTYPSVTFGVLIIFVLLSENMTLKEANKKIIISGACWVIGYGLMWASKWVIASIITGKDVIENAFTAVQNRSSNTIWNNEQVSRIDVLWKTLSLQFNVVTYVILWINLVYILITCILNRKRYSMKNIKSVIIVGIPVLLIAIVPIAWYLIVANHTVIHPFLSFRTAIPLWLAVLFIIYMIINEGAKKCENMNVR